MHSAPASSAVAPSHLPPGPAFAHAALTARLAARMTFASGSAEAVGKFNKAPSARATASFRESLARKLGGSAEEGEFSAALLTDGAVVQVAGSAVLAGGLIRDCDWAAGDLDVWSPALWKSGRCELEGDHALGTGAGYRKPPFRCVTAFLNKSWGAVAPSARALAGAKRSSRAAGGV